MNLRWSWDERTRDLFRWVDPAAWDASVHDPVRLLGLRAPGALGGAGRGPGVPPLPVGDRRRAGPLPHPPAVVPEPAPPTAHCARWPTSRPSSGYREALPQYSGGLGVLAGDHLKAASRPRGAARRRRASSTATATSASGSTSTGGSRSSFPDPRPVRHGPHAVRGRAHHRRPGRRAADRADLAGRRRAHAAVPAGRRHRREHARDPRRHRPPVRRRHRAPHPPGDPPRHRRRAGPAGARHRRRRCSTRTRATPASSGLERIRELVGDGLDPADALEAVRAGCVFTTHTPVPAGIDRFPRELMEQYFSRSWSSTAPRIEELMALGRRRRRARRGPLQHGGDGPAPRRRGPTAWRSCTAAVSREMFAGLWPDVPVDEVPIGSRHQRRPRADVGLARDRRPAARATCCRVGRRRRRRLAARRRHPRRRAVAGAGAGPGADGGVRPASACGVVQAGPGAVGERRGVDRRRARPEDAHGRLRPPLRHVQAGHAAALAARAAASALLLAPRPAGPVRLRRQGPPGRRRRQGDDPADRTSSPPRPTSATGSCSSTTTTSHVARALVPGLATCG